MSTRRQIFHHPFWNPVATPAQLPNVLGAAVQSEQLQQGDCCYVVSTATVYTCTVRTLGAAVWAVLGPGAAVAPIGAKASIMNTAGQLIPGTGAPTALDFDTSEYAIAGTFITAPTVDLVANTITVTATAYYRVSGAVTFGGAGPAGTTLALIANGITPLVITALNSQVLWTMQTERVMELVAGTVLSAGVTLGGGVDIGTAGGQTRLAVEQVF